MPTTLDSSGADVVNAHVASVHVANADFVVDLEGFEGPIDLLLSLARAQKVDLAKISILALAEQYLAYVERARHLKLELAADYLVMAAWLAYLKSRLLLPEAPGDDEPSGAELAEALALRLRRLAAIRRAAQDMLMRPRLGHARFARGCPEGLAVRYRSRLRLTLHELLQAYVDQRLRTAEQRLTIAAAPVFRVEDALRRLTALLGGPGILPMASGPALTDIAYAQGLQRPVGFADLVEKVKPAVISVRVKITEDDDQSTGSGEGAVFGSFSSRR